MYDKVTVAEAAERLKVSQGAIRQRIHRGTLEHERDKQGRVYVYISPDDTEDDDVNYGVNDALVEELKARIAFLGSELEGCKEENRRKDHLLAAALERIPAIEAPQETPSEARDAPMSVTDEPDSGTGTRMGGRANVAFVVA